MKRSIVTKYMLEEDKQYLKEKLLSFLIVMVGVLCVSVVITMFFRGLFWLAQQI